MIHPSYVELMKVVNNDVTIGEEPVVNSRYSIVCATARRARQIIDGYPPLMKDEIGKKPLSIAVDELYSGELKILGENEREDDEPDTSADSPLDVFIPNESLDDSEDNDEYAFEDLSASDEPEEEGENEEDVDQEAKEAEETIDEKIEETIDKEVIDEVSPS